MLPFKESLCPVVVFQACPLRASLDILGRKWSLLILYSLGFMKINRFNEMLHYMPELTGSLLAKRLGHLEKTGYVRRIKQTNGSRIGVTWQLTQKGKDTVPIIKSIIAHSSRWNARELFEDGTPKNLEQIFPQQTQSRRPLPPTIRVKQSE